MRTPRRSWRASFRCAPERLCHPRGRQRVRRRAGSCSTWLRVERPSRNASHTCRPVAAGVRSRCWPWTGAWSPRVRPRPVGRDPDGAVSGRYRARWKGEYREAKGFRLFLVDEERIVRPRFLAPGRQRGGIGTRPPAPQGLGLYPRRSGAAVRHRRRRVVDLEVGPTAVPLGAPGARFLPPQPVRA